MHAVLLVTLACLRVGQLAQPPAPTDNIPSAEHVEVRYARAQLQLAEANLKRVQRMNQRLARSVPESVVAEYQQDADVARLQLEQAQPRSPGGEFQVWLRRAESESKRAESYWKKAVAVNVRSAKSFETLDIERFRLRAEVARLEFERGQALVQATHEAQLQWEVDLLNNEVQRVKEEATRVTPFIRVYPNRR